MIRATKLVAFALIWSMAEGFGGWVGKTRQTTTKVQKSDELQNWIVSAALSLAVLASPLDSAFADGQTKDFKLPPIDKTDKNRCVLNSSKMGQANAARDKLYDLRQCNLQGSDASG